MERKFNFSAGPGALPEQVLEEARNEMMVYKDAGASIMEISHRSPQYTAVAESARSSLRSLLGLDDEWSILFLQSGASLQFYQSAINFLKPDTVGNYVVTGSWAKNALAQGVAVGATHVAASSADQNFNYVPGVETWDISDRAAYVHVTSNNTIYGTQMKGDPSIDVPMICDASSDFLSRPIDTSKYGLIYAGAQKNIGPAGATVVLIKQDFLDRIPDGVPTLLDYRTHVSKLFHTPPVFAVYMIEKVLRWIESIGDLEAMKIRNDDKAALLYNRIDASEYFTGVAMKDSRSNMNVTFRLPSEELEGRFIAEARTAGLLALKGHRSAGGVRASIYNACPVEAVEALIEFMDAFESENG